MSSRMSVLPWGRSGHSAWVAAPKVGMTIRRAPRGIPEGGQFRPQVRAETTATLDDPTAVAYEQARKSSRYWASKYGVDADDLTGETIAAYLLAVKGGSCPENVTAYVKAIARSKALNLLAASRNGVAPRHDVEALAHLKRQISEEEARLRRSLSPAEVERLARRLRESLPPGQRPTSGYWMDARTVSLDGLDVDVADCSPAPVSSTRSLADVLADAAENLPASAGTAKRAHQYHRVRTWDAIAASYGAPAAAMAIMSSTTASTCRKRIAATGGVGAAVARYRADVPLGSESDSDKALFSPFGSLGPAGKERVVAVLQAHPAYAEALWDAALSRATRRRPDRLERFDWPDESSGPIPVEEAVR